MAASGKAGLRTEGAVECLLNLGQGENRSLAADTSYGAVPPGRVKKICMLPGSPTKTRWPWLATIA